MQVYILTEKKIIAALKRAEERGVKVRITLEKNVFGNTYINTKTFNSLRDNGIDIVWANNDLFTFTHTKMFLVDDVYVLGT